MRLGLRIVLHTAAYPVAAASFIIHWLSAKQSVQLQCCHGLAGQARDCAAPPLLRSQSARFPLPNGAGVRWAPVGYSVLAPVPPAHVCMFVLYCMRSDILPKRPAKRSAATGCMA